MTKEARIYNWERSTSSINGVGKTGQLYVKQLNWIIDTFLYHIKNKLRRIKDLNVRPDIYPWLCNLYIDEEYRNKGYGRILLESVKGIAKSKLDFNELIKHL